MYSIPYISRIIPYEHLTEYTQSCTILTDIGILKTYAHKL